ncbi:MAG TPA: hypothetical protein VLM40_09110 [Gemmata sp.]|nr:hypothetical protein [Gemmata sp.]
MSILGVLCSLLDLNTFTQIGSVVLVWLAEKYAIGLHKINLAGRVKYRSRVPANTIGVKLPFRDPGALVKCVR